jgi:thiol-disulfide isomerase/thioredoxin
MNKKLKTFLLFAGFALFIAIAVFAYNMLGQKVTPQNEIEVTQEKGEVSPTQNGEVSQPQAGEASQAQEEEKTKAPDFTVLNADGASAKLSDFIGKPVVLNFWASWCPPCKGEMPEFNEVYQDVGQDVAFMMVDLVDGQRETKEKGAQYVKDQGYSFPVYFDTNQDAANTYGIMSIPTTIFIDKDGYVVTGAQGAIDAEALRKGIDMIK